MFSTTPQSSLSTAIPYHVFTAFVLRASLKKELKELPAIQAQKASFKPLPAEMTGKYASDATFFFFFWDDPRWGLQVGVGDGRDGCDGGDGGGGDGARASRWW
jgi:hypothetical protein